MPAFSRQYLSAEVPIVCKTMAVINKGAEASPANKLETDIANGIMIPKATTPTQKVRARLPYSSSLAEYCAVFEVLIAFHR